MSDTTPLEATLTGVVEALRHEYDAALRRHGLYMEPPKISVLRSDPASYTSEMLIDIVQLDTRQLVDRLEFFAFEDGKPALTGEELHIWLVEQIAGLAKEPP